MMTVTSRGPGVGDARGAGDQGFSLIEVMISMTILATGLLSLAGVFIMGLNHLSSSSSALVAREKAREAVESVHSARDTRVIRWCQIYNVGAARNPGCAAEAAAVFLAGPQALGNPGPDGLVNTADDVGIEESLSPGPDNLLGNADDVRTPLSNYLREIEIAEIVRGGVVDENLRRVRVRIWYGKLIFAAGVWRPERVYELTTYVSSIS